MMYIYIYINIYIYTLYNQLWSSLLGLTQIGGLEYPMHRDLCTHYQEFVSIPPKMPTPRNHGGTHWICAKVEVSNIGGKWLLSIKHGQSHQEKNVALFWDIFFLMIPLVTGITQSAHVWGTVFCFSPPRVIGSKYESPFDFVSTESPHSLWQW